MSMKAHSRGCWCLGAGIVLGTESEPLLSVCLSAYYLIQSSPPYQWCLHLFFLYDLTAGAVTYFLYDGLGSTQC